MMTTTTITSKKVLLRKKIC